MSKCMDVCPQHLIEMVPMKQVVMLDAIVMIKELLLIKIVKQDVLDACYVQRYVQLKQLQ